MNVIPLQPDVSHSLIVANGEPCESMAHPPPSARINTSLDRQPAPLASRHLATAVCGAMPPDLYLPAVQFTPMPFKD